MNVPPLIVHLEPGEPRREWCDECLVTHMALDVLGVTDHGVSVVGTWREKCKEADPCAD